ncbi:MAG: hypothetical protein WBO71_17685 [Thermoanaerobaculia bacterium]
MNRRALQPIAGFFGRTERQPAMTSSLMEALIPVRATQVLRGSITLTWISDFRLQRKLTSPGAR